MKRRQEPIRLWAADYRGHNRAASAVAAALVALWLGTSPALAHLPLSAETADALLARVAALTTASTTAATALERAEALFALAETVDRIIETLNRDLAAHHGELGLTSTVLVHELKAGGITLSLWREANRYKSYLRPFEDYVSLAPSGPKRAEAQWRLLQGRFYDSFIYDPLQTVNLEWLGLVAAIEDAEAFLARHPEHQGREEVQFILAVNYVRAAHSALDAALTRAYSAKAHAALTAFSQAYPGSMRAAAAAALLTTLPASD